MSATDIFVALWKQKTIIALFLSVALLACYGFLFVGQTYTASVYIKYLEDNAANGNTTNGAKLDPYEITNTYVVEKALKQLGMMDKNVNSIAQKIKVTPVISAAEQEKYASWIDQFSDYEDTEEKKATAVYYRIDFKSNDGVEFAKEFLSALIQQYRSYYTERYSGYCEISIVPKSVVLESDYFYSVDQLQTQIENAKSYLSNISSGDTDYRSPVTGYSLDDLVDSYDLLLETKVAPVMQYILDTGVSKDIATLVAKLQQSSDIAQQESDANVEKANTQKEMMLLYAEKNKEYVSTVIDSDDYANYVYGDVERDRIYIRDLTVYDQFMMDYVDYAVKSENLLIDKVYIDQNLSKFGDMTSTGIAPVEEISNIYDQYVNLMNITEQTLEGYNSFKSGKVILQVCGIQTTEALPELLYYTVSGILAICLGCGLIVVREVNKEKVNNETKQKDLSDGVL